MNVDEEAQRVLPDGRTLHLLRYLFNWRLAVSPAGPLRAVMFDDEVVLQVARDRVARSAYVGRRRRRWATWLEQASLDRSLAKRRNGRLRSGFEVAGLRQVALLSD